MLRRLRPARLFGAILCLLLLLRGATDAQVDLGKLPAPTGYVSDLAGVVDAGQKADLEAFCTRVDHELGVQLALVTVDSVGDRPIRDVALDIARKWGVGPAKDNGGVLLLLAVKDRKNDIEVGRGVEPYLTDGFSGSTLRAMRPQLRASDYGAALLSAAHTMAAQIATGKGIAFNDNAQPEPDRPVRSSRGRGIPFPLIVLGIFFLLWLFSRGGGRRGGGGTYRRGGGGGFLPGFILGNLLGGGGRGNWGGGSWGGGGFGGGDSGGGGGFGGFGGGDFGGGGASSDW